MRDDKCCYPGCGQLSDIIYLTKPLCDKHWGMIDTNPELLRKKIGLPPPEVVTPAARVPQKARQRTSPGPQTSRQAVPSEPQVPPRRSVGVAKSHFTPRVLVRRPSQPTVGSFNTTQKSKRPARWGSEG